MNQALVLDYNDLGRIAGGIGAFKKLQVLRSSAKSLFSHCSPPL
jgi:hypothetical protein